MSKKRVVWQLKAELWIAIIERLSQIVEDGQGPSVPAAVQLLLKMNELRLPFDKDS